MACPNFRERTARVKLELTDFDKPSSKRCCVKGCYSTYEDVPKPSFYRFPQLNIEQRKLWIKAVNKKKTDGGNWTPHFTTRVCSVHFVTGKSLSEALFFAEHRENMLCTEIVLNVRNNFCTQHVLPRFELGIFMY